MIISGGSSQNRSTSTLSQEWNISKYSISPLPISSISQSYVTQVENKLSIVDFLEFSSSFKKKIKQLVL